ncbi:MAG: hypothetical protein PUF17_07265 [Lactimicrobium massiliense]|nr:hypothetical protein [Lactimicrobium massiliense]MDD6560754.1 hypothetical protein [Lactimicrobium massiliense]
MFNRAKKADIRTMIGIDGYGDGYIKRTDGDTVFLFGVEAQNLNVLSYDNIRGKVESLAGLGRALGKIEFFALDDRENYASNRQYLQQRIKEETSPEIRALLLKEDKFIRTLESDTSSARKFLIAYRVVRGHEKEARSVLSHFQQVAAHSGMGVRLLSKQEVQEVIAMYFRQDTTTPDGDFEDIDGLNYYKDVDFDLMRERMKNGDYAETIASLDFGVPTSGTGKDDETND